MLAFRQGDVAAFDALFERWAAPLLRYLERMVRDTASAEELVQERVDRAFPEERERFRQRVQNASPEERKRLLHRIGTMPEERRARREILERLGPEERRRLEERIEAATPEQRRSMRRRFLDASPEERERLVERARHRLQAPTRPEPDAMTRRLEQLPAEERRTLRASRAAARSGTPRAPRPDLALPIPAAPGAGAAARARRRAAIPRPGGAQPHRTQRRALEGDEPRRAAAPARRLGSSAQAPAGRTAAAARSARTGVRSLTAADGRRTHPGPRYPPCLVQGVPVGQVFSEIDESNAAFIRKQHVFFVASAPISGEGLVNLSPKGLESFAILGPRSVAYLDLVGSGIETVAHLRENGRIVLMFCSFEGPPRILRLHGRGEVVEPGDDDWDALASRFPTYPNARSVVRVEVTRIADSCGYGVPLYRFEGERDQILRWAERKSPQQIVDYQEQNNRKSLDGLPGLSRKLS